MNQSNFQELNYLNFEAAMTGKTILVDFWAEWCHPCKTQRLMLTEIHQHYKEQLEVALLNVDDNKLIANQHSVRNLPTLILFRDGKEIRRFIGLQNKEQLIHQINAQLTKIQQNG